MLAFTLSQVANLVTYQDPQITQFTGYDLRDGTEEEINLGESKGGLVFALVEQSTGNIVPIDPTMLNLVV